MREEAAMEIHTGDHGASATDIITYIGVPLAVLGGTSRTLGTRRMSEEDDQAAGPE